MAVERRAVFANLGTVNVWSGTVDETWESKTYKPGILIGDEAPSGAALSGASSPGLGVYIKNVPTLRSDVQSGDEFEFHICRKTKTGWEKIGGFWGLVNEVTGPSNDIEITTLPFLERATKVTRPRWSKEDYRSRYPSDGFMDDLEELRTEGARMNIITREN